MIPALIAALGGLMGSGAGASALGAAGSSALGGAAAPAAGGGFLANAMAGGAPAASAPLSTLAGGPVGSAPGMGLWTDLISPDTPTPAPEKPWYHGLFGDDGTESSPAPALPNVSASAPALHAPPKVERRKRTPSQFTMPASLRSLMGG